MGTKELIDAIQSGDAEGIENTFQGVMSAKGESESEGHRARSKEEKVRQRCF